MANYTPYAPAETLPWVSPLEIVSNEQDMAHEPLILGRGIKVEGCSFRGELRVDIRDWTKEGQRTKKGISLPNTSWKELLRSKQLILNTIEQMKDKPPVNECFHLGNDIFATIKSPYWLVDIRYWYKTDDGSLKPGRRGTSLKFPEFNKLMEFTPAIEQALESYAATAQESYAATPLH